MGDTVTQPIRTWRPDDASSERTRSPETELLFAPGTKFGRFELGAPLGSGGMAVVVEALDPHLGRRVAIKLLRPTLGHADAHERMLVEARALARLNHPNVVTVYEVDIANGVAYLVMELVSGETLARYLETRRSWRDIVARFVAAGRGLAAAHAAGVVHRDFKPKNVMVDREGRVRVVDFGVCDIQASAKREVDTVLGTPSYMAPEQIDGRELDARADQFAFCVSLFEALYRSKPFAGATADEVRASMHAPLAIPPTPGVPARLAAIVRRGLAIDPADRFADMDTLLAELERDPARRARRAVAGLAIATVAVIGAVGWLRPAPSGPAACATPEPMWDAARGHALEQHFLALRPSRELVTNTSQRLAEYATRWHAAHDRACAAPASHARIVAEACLYRLRDQFTALADVLATTSDRFVVEAAPAAVASLSVPQTCLTEPRVTALDPPSPDVRRRLDHAEALARAGRYRDASVALDAAVRDPAVARSALYAHAELVRGNVAIELGDGATAEASLRRAAAAAAVQRDDELVARAYIELMFALSYVQDRARDALAIQPFAEVAVARAGNTAGLRARLAFQIGSALVELGRYDDASAALTRADRIWTDELDPDDLAHARVLNTIANVAGYRGKPADAIAAYQRALAIREGTLGHDHPDLAGLLANLGNARNATGAFAEARAACTRADELAASDGDHAMALACQARAARGRGHLAAAAELLERALAKIEDSTVGNHRYYLLVELGEVALARGDLAAAASWCDRARGVFGDLDDHPDAARVLACTGQILLARGAIADARTELAKAAALVAGMTGGNRWVGDLRFALARALDDRESDRARELAASARAIFVQTGDTAGIARIDAWRAAD